MAKILIVDDEPVILNLLTKILVSEGYETVSATSAEKALDILRDERFDLLVTDVRMEAMDGIQLLKKSKELVPEMGVIILTAYGSVGTAVEAMKEGAFDYITKPFKLDELLVTVERTIEYHSAIAENKGLKSRLEAKLRLESMVAESEAMSKVCEMVERVAPTSATVLVQGESGTGKELVARALHNNSPRREKPFIAVNCAALPENLLESEMFGYKKGAFTGANSDKTGLFEAAESGTLLLDEINSMPINLQSKLLRVLQERTIRKVGGTESIPVDVRIIASSNRDLEEEIKDGRFREDLFYRLSVISINVPPLRERPEDILPIIQHTIRRECMDDNMPTIDSDAQSVLLSYSWPGNVRELENVVQHCLAFVRDGRIGRETLPPKIIEAARNASGGMMPRASSATEAYKGKSLKAFLRSKEKEYLLNVIKSMDGDKEKAAKALNISLATLYRKIADD